nr:hypothetical protein [Thermoanaerobaculia bacterium]
MSKLRSISPSKAQPAEAPAASDEHAKLVEALATGALRFYQLPAEMPAEEAARVRRQALEASSGTSL